jgi:ABC-type transport system involved in multi-copper enzyme maturation permease subunit
MNAPFQGASSGHPLSGWSMTDVDWAFIVSVIISFVALIFTYDRICGEKERGTLRMTLAAPVRRHEILIGKYAAALLALGVPLSLGVLVNLLIVGLSRDVAISADDVSKIVAVVGLSLSYLSIFVLLGMLVSSRTARGANSMVILLLVWVGLVVLIPGLGRIICDTAHKSPTEAELRRKLDDMREQFDRDSAAGKFGRNVRTFGSSVDENPPGTARFVKARTEAANQLYDDHLNRMIAPAIFGRSYTRFSPAVVYQCACEAVAGTGIRRFQNWYRQAKDYQQELREQVRTIDAEDPNSLHLLCDHNQAVERWGVISKKPVDFDAIPKFQERDLPLGASLNLAMWDVGLLILLNLVFFAVTFVSFLRYDVR